VKQIRLSLAAASVLMTLVSVTAEAQWSYTSNSLSILASTTPRSKSQLCAKLKDISEFQKQLKDSANRVSFRNTGGIANGGVCWWYSRFERNATYLAYFNDRKPKPSQAQVMSIISALRRGDRLVEIPGFTNLSNFTFTYRAEIQASLEQWQVSDGVWGGGWLQGLQGRGAVSAQDMKRILDETYDTVVRRKRVDFHLLPFGAIVNHAWLVVGMNRIANGYLIEVADSNFPGTVQVHRYQYGMTSLQYPYMGTTVPNNRSSYAAESERVLQTLIANCKR